MLELFQPQELLKWFEGHHRDQPGYGVLLSTRRWTQKEPNRPILDNKRKEEEITVADWLTLFEKHFGPSLRIQGDIRQTSQAEEGKASVGSNGIGIR